jgi:hypothetical protein
MLLLIENIRNLIEFIDIIIDIMMINLIAKQKTQLSTHRPLRARSIHSSERSKYRNIEIKESRDLPA